VFPVRQGLNFQMLFRMKLRPDGKKVLALRDAMEESCTLSEYSYLVTGEP
jgi:hypothetical protein